MAALETPLPPGDNGENQTILPACVACVFTAGYESRPLVYNICNGLENIARNKGVDKATPGALFYDFRCDPENKYNNKDEGDNRLCPNPWWALLWAATRTCRL